MTNSIICLMAIISSNLMSPCSTAELFATVEGTGVDNYVSVGQQFVLKCTVPADPNRLGLKLTWLFGEHLIKETSDTDDAFSYTVNATHESSGVYKCRATFTESGVQKSLQDDVVIETYKGQFIDHTARASGEPAILQCGVNVEGSASFNITWTKQGNDVIPGRGKYSITNNETHSSLVVLGSFGDPTLLGRYECHITPTGGTQDLGSAVYLHARPNVTLVPDVHKALTTQKGTRHNISCVCVANPIPEVSWTKDGTSLELPNVHTIDEESRRTSIIAFTDLSYDDRGLYTCEAKNVLGSMKKSIRLRVQDRLGAWLPFIGIVAEVVVLATIVSVFEWRHKRKLQEEAVEFQNLTKLMDSQK